jgi:hypothetical protein
MHNHVAEKVKHGKGARVFAMMEEGGLRRLVCLGDFDAMRHHFNQMACLAGGVAMQQLLEIAYGPGAPSGAPLGAWTDRVSRSQIVLPADCFALAASGPSDPADLLGAMAWYKDWPAGTETLPGTKHLCTSMGEVGGLFYASRDTFIVRTGRAQERSAVKRVEEALLVVKRMGYTVSGEAGLLKFMKHYAEAKYLQVLHTVEPD